MIEGIFIQTHEWQLLILIMDLEYMLEYRYLRLIVIHLKLGTEKNVLLTNIDL